MAQRLLFPTRRSWSNVGCKSPTTGTGAKCCNEKTDGNALWRADQCNWQSFRVIGEKKHLGVFSFRSLILAFLPYSFTMVRRAPQFSLSLLACARVRGLPGKHSKDPPLPSVTGSVSLRSLKSPKTGSNLDMSSDMTKRQHGFSRQPPKEFRSI